MKWIYSSILNLYLPFTLYFSLFLVFLSLYQYCARSEYVKSYIISEMNLSHSFLLPELMNYFGPKRGSLTKLMPWKNISIYFLLKLCFLILTDGLTMSFMTKKKVCIPSLFKKCFSELNLSYLNRNSLFHSLIKIWELCN